MSSVETVSQLQLLLDQLYQRQAELEALRAYQQQLESRLAYLKKENKKYKALFYIIEKTPLGTGLMNLAQRIFGGKKR